MMSSDLFQNPSLSGIRLIREARALYDSIFPPTDAVSETPNERGAHSTQPGTSTPAPIQKGLLSSFPRNRSPDKNAMRV
ncbi:MAG TPA: hypothetical protein VF450_03230, partial [Noviherbaspirillum sp.]